MTRRRLSLRTKVLLWSASGIVLLAFGNAIDPGYQVRFNPTGSAPRGFYLFAPASDIHVGSQVFVRLPVGIAGFAAARNYLPLGVPLLKRVGAVAGQHVCERGGAIRIDGEPVARVLNVDGKGRPLPHWTGCRMLGPDELYLLSTYNAASFDSRYFGAVSRRAVIARATPLWTW